jgi:hypothetical protein
MRVALSHQFISWQNMIGAALLGSSVFRRAPGRFPTGGLEFARHKLRRRAVNGKEIAFLERLAGRRQGLGA